MTLRVALLGAECTGKSTLCNQLAESLAAEGLRCRRVDEYLREWCDTHGRTPTASEQATIASVQQARIEQAVDAEVLLADTTPFVTAAYSEWLFDDLSLYPEASRSLRRFDIVLLAATDLPWVADGLQRDGAGQRASLDACLRAALAQAGIAYQVIYGLGPERLRNAQFALRASGRLPEGVGLGWAPDDEAGGLRRWSWTCEKCSDPQCEHRLFTEALRLRAAGPGPA